MDDNKFSDLKKRRSKKSALINFDTELLARLDALAKKIGVSRTKLVAHAVSSLLTKESFDGEKRD